MVSQGRLRARRGARALAPAAVTHRCRRAAAGLCHRRTHVLRLDVAKFFPSVDHRVLLALLRPRTPAAWWPVCQRIVRAPAHVESTRFYFPGDGLFAPLCRPHGIPIGNLTWLAPLAAWRAFGALAPAAREQGPGGWYTSTMTTKTVRAVPRGGQLELLEPLDLPEGKLVEVTIQIPGEPAARPTAPAFAAWDLGAREPITRDEIYGDDLL